MLVKCERKLVNFKWGLLPVYITKKVSCLLPLWWNIQNIQLLSLINNTPSTSKIFCLKKYSSSELSDEARSWSRSAHARSVYAIGQSIKICQFTSILGFLASEDTSSAARLTKKAKQSLVWWKLSKCINLHNYLFTAICLSNSISTVDNS